jgi:para-aminobenzoate synthetase component 1
MFDTMNRLGADGIPFLFIVDFDCLRPIVIPLDDVDPGRILYSVNGRCNYKPELSGEPPAYAFSRRPVSYERYRAAFDMVQSEMRAGNTFLLNLTFPTEVETNLTLAEIFRHAKAPYRLLFDDRFTVFSPECFVRIENGIIRSFPMKGTIDRSLPDARNTILNDEKEAAEHITIVDLIRNDLSRVASDVRVERYRYIGEVHAGDKVILQVSTEIAGTLGGGYCRRIGDILRALLPAGSVTGAPKPKTVEIIKRAEGYERGYYTGVFGIFDGRNLDSAVMIRFIERDGDKMIFKSGGGVTIYSLPEAEYREMTEKVYVPFSGIGSVVQRSSAERGISS